MQKQKIFSYELAHPEHLRHVEEFLASLIELKKRYLLALESSCAKSDIERELGTSCLLCFPLGLEEKAKELSSGRSSQFQPGDCAVLGCPWIVITGMSCDGHSFSTGKRAISIEMSAIKTPYNSINHDIIKERIANIERWIAIYQCELFAKQEAARGYKESNS